MAEPIPSLYLVVSTEGEEHLRPFATEKKFDEAHYEADIERWIKNSLKLGEPILGDLAVFAQQPRLGGSSHRAIDLLAIDEDENIVVIEFKRGETDETIIFQVLNYTSWVSEQPYEVFNEKALEFFRKEALPYTSLKDLYVKTFRIGSPDEEEETERGEEPVYAPALTDEEFREGFNRTPRIIIVAARISDEVGRIIRLLNSKGELAIEGHEFKYYESRKGEKLISRTAILAEKKPVGPPQPSYLTVEEIQDYTTAPVLKRAVTELPQWCASAYDPSDVKIYYRSYTDFAVRIAGKVRLAFSYAKKWMYAWVPHRFQGDLDWLQSSLSKPNEVKVAKDEDSIRFHVETEDDLQVLKDLIAKIVDEVTV